jgi:hypothetical protein
MGYQDDNSFDLDAFQALFDENNIEGDQKIGEELGALDNETRRLLFNIFNDNGVEDNSPVNNKQIDLIGDKFAKWASCNFGTDRPNNVGAYIAYEDIGQLNDEWKGNWGVPGFMDLNLLRHFRIEIKKDYQDVVGLNFIGTNSNSIFIPLTGYKKPGDDKIYAENDGFIWGEDRWCLHFTISQGLIDYIQRHQSIGLSESVKEEMIKLELVEDNILIPIRPLWKER